MKEKKSSKKPDPASAGIALVDQPAQVKAAENSTPVAENEQPGKKASHKKAAAKSEKPGKPAQAVKAAKEEKKPLNFKVSSEFRREFKTFASAHDMKLSKLLVLAFESFRKQRGD
jgi:hypothetical protein